jgi:predicted nucleotidyltransferase
MPNFMSGFPHFPAWYDRPMADVSPETLPTEEALSVLCRRWRIRELSLFGSLARGDAGPASDADILVAFQSDESWDLWDMVDLRDELADLFHRPVDVVVEGAIRNPIRRQSIMRDKRRLYAA